MSCLVEVYSESDLKKVFKTDAEIIGINNRNLKNFTVDINNSLRIRRLIPDKYLTVSESGIEEYNHIKILKDAGFNGALIGTSLLKAPDTRAKLQELKGLRGCDG